LATCYFQPNYGSVLQAFATQEYLTKINVPNQTINIGGISRQIRNKKLIYFLKNITKKDIFFDKIGNVGLFIKKKTNKTIGNNAKLRESIFRKFYSEHFNLTKPFSNFREIGVACSDECMAVLVGSDQLWLPSNIEADYYTLNFVPDNINKISYATSFGVSSLPKRQAKLASAFLMKFSALSVRELSGQRIISELTGETAQVVCDPVLLLTAEEWSRYCGIERKYSDKYIFCYLLGRQLKHYDWVKSLAQKTGCKIVGFNSLDSHVSVDKSFFDCEPYNITPLDFVNLIMNAEYICTDSFHCTVFSIIFHKRFFTFKRFSDNTSMSTNSRLDSLFTVLNIENRYTTGETELDKALASEIDYMSIDESVIKFRDKSVKYLKEALNIE
jgi:hypothetical protein